MEPPLPADARLGSEGAIGHGDSHVRPGPKYVDTWPVGAKN